MRKPGSYKKIGDVEYYIPKPLPPQNPSFEITPDIAELYGEAKYHLGLLNEMANRIPDTWRFIKAYITKEALLSSSIEGINTTMLEVFTQKLLKTKQSKNTQLVVNYTDALTHALMLMESQNLPISSRVILEAHKELMQAGTGENADPVNYRKQAVRVGRFIPPPAFDIPLLMSDLEAFINMNDSVPAIIKAGLAHAQFETIHPFLDGNGRIGRMLITLMLLQDDILSEPLLYTSYYFKKHHTEYYKRLNKSHTEGDFEGWIQFFLKAVKESSVDAYKRAQAIEQLENESRDLIEKEKYSEKKKLARLEILSLLFSNPVTSITQVAEVLDVAYNTAHTVVDDLVKLGILHIEDKNAQRSKLYSFKQYITILEKDFSD